MNTIINTERIDLHMPRDWNAMTVTELETVARVLINATASGRDAQAVKVELFLALTGLIVIEGVNPAKPVEEQYIVVARTGHAERLNLYLWQIDYWMREQMKWIDQPSTLITCPYKEYVVWSWRGRHKYEGPATLMQNFQWRQYRLAGEYYSYFIMESNRLVEMQKREGVSEADLKRQAHAVARAKGMFLATLFCRKVKFVDTETRLVKRDYAYVSWQSMKNWRDFASFPDVKFQVVLFWWSGTMKWLEKKYPKCFRSSEPKKHAKTDPLTLYTRQTATMEKYLSTNEEQLNHELYTNVLQHMQDMVDESDRMKEMSRK